MDPFPIVYADPDWDYAQRSPWKESRFGGGVSGHYETSDVLDLEAIAPQFHAMKPDSGIMLMWVTGPHYETGARVMRSWGYSPIKPIWYWCKTYPGAPNLFYGPGAYTGSNVEYILMGQANMGRLFTPAKSGGTKGVNEVICEPPHFEDAAIFHSHPRDHNKKIIHSRKPDVFRELIVRLFGEHRRVEVFARERAPGWHAIGDQLPNGQLMIPGQVIEPLPPVTAYEAAVRHRGQYQQASLLFDRGA
jgi:N6-adenosine-specific RNA methylase IME4